MATLWEHYQEGGWAMWVILFWLILAIAIIAERSVYLYKSSINKDVFLSTMQKCILAGDIARQEAAKYILAASPRVDLVAQANFRNSATGTWLQQASCPSTSRVWWNDCWLRV